MSWTRQKHDSRGCTRTSSQDMHTAEGVHGQPDTSNNIAETDLQYADNKAQTDSRSAPTQL
eukprot:5225835-Amphidinium_carterae.1